MSPVVPLVVTASWPAVVVGPVAAPCCTDSRPVVPFELTSVALLVPPIVMSPVCARSVPPPALLRVASPVRSALAADSCTVLLAAFSGALWTMGRAETESRMTAAWLLARVMLTAVVLTGGVAALLAQFMVWSLDHVLPAVAFLIGAMGDKIGSLREAAAQRLRALIGGA